MIMIPDNSGSVTGGNDPIGERFAEAWLAIARVGARCRCGHELIDIASFDTPTSLDLPPTPIVGANSAAIKQSLAVPPDGAGSSCLAPSLARAEATARAYPGHHVILVVLSDFQLFDSDPSGVLKRMLAFRGDVHAVVLRAEPPQVLIDAPNVTVTRVNYTSPPGTVARAVFRALTTKRLAAAPLPPVQPETASGGS